MTSAQKANRTRKARQAFKNHYGEESYEVVSLIARGKNSNDIWREAYYVPMTSISSYRANFTRGTYDHLLTDCNF